MDLIIHYVTSSHLSILWNGSKLGSFQPSKGLHQGDPRSPYLFVLCMEKLSVMIQQKVVEGSWKPIYVSRNGPGFTHLLFADDILLFYNGKKSQVCLVMKTMEDFCRMSGLKINLENSRAMASKSLTTRKKGSLMMVTSVRFIGDIGKYLSIPILKGRVTRDLFNGLAINWLHG